MKHRITTKTDCSFSSAHADVVLVIGLHISLHRLWINLHIKFGSKTNERNTTKNKFITYLCFIVVDLIHSCHHRLKMSSFSLKKNIFRSIDLTCWRSTRINVTTAFGILKFLEYEFLKGFLVKGRQQSFWIFSILPNILDLEWCLSNKQKFDPATVHHVYLPRWQRWRAQ